MMPYWRQNVNGIAFALSFPLKEMLGGSCVVITGAVSHRALQPACLAQDRGLLQV